MFNDRRRFWTSLVFFCFFTLFVVLLAVSWLSPAISKPLAPLPGAPAGSNVGSGGGGMGGATGGTPASRANIPILAAGDGREVWIALPVQGESKLPGFELLYRAANTATWRIAARNGTQTFWGGQGFPRALVLLLPPPAQPFVFGENGWINQYSAENWLGRGFFPPGHIVKAVASAPGQLFAITLGTPLATTTRPGDPLNVELPGAGSTPFPTAPPAAGTLPKSASAPATPVEPSITEAASGARPAATTAANSSASSEIFNTYWFPPTPSAAPTGSAGSASEPAGLTAMPGTWAYLPPLGPPGAAGVPTASSLIALAAAQDRLIVMWVDLLHNRELYVRTLNYTSRDVHWSDVITTQLPENQAIPVPESRLMTVMLDGALYVLWTAPLGPTVALHGGWMNTDLQSPAFGTIPRENMLSPMSLGAAGQGVSPTADVAVAASENSILAIVAERDDTLLSVLFDNRGHPLSGPVAVEPHLAPRELQIGQNIAMVLLVLILTLSLWQWRQKPVPLALPEGMIVAPLHLRAGAFLIDAAIPYIAVVAIFGTGEGGGYFSLIWSWVSSLAHPEDLLKSVELFVFMGIYLVHVTLGELFFRRSIGKAAVGLQVLMLDGKAPTLAAILLRNLIRLPELAVGIVILYVLISDRHQRLGDFLARTLVVAHRAPETPADPDKEPPRK